MKKKALAKTNHAFSASQVGVFVEDLRNEIRAVAESQTLLIKKIDMIFDIWTLKEDVSVLKVDMKIVKTDVTEIKNIISDHGERLLKVEELVVK